MGESTRFQFLRPLGGERRLSVACDGKAPAASRLCVVERIARATLSDKDRKELEARVRIVSDFSHPRVVGVRELAEQGSEVLVVSDFVDAEPYGSLLDPPGGARRPSLEVLLRVLMDVLDVLGSMHAHQGDDGKPQPLFHGGITPSAVLVDERGIVRLANVCRGPRPGASTEYAPPEILSGGSVDARTDVFAVGALLWRALMGGAPRPEHVPASGVTPEVPWAAPLVDVVRGAVVEAREQRWPGAAAMAREIRRASGERIASAGDVGAHVKETFGEGIKARRSALAQLDDDAPPPSSSELVSMSDLEVVAPAAPPLPEPAKKAPEVPHKPAAAAASTPPAKPAAPGGASQPPPPLPKKAAIARVELVKHPPKVLEAEAVEAVEAVEEEPAPQSEGLPLVKKKAATPAEPPPPAPEATAAASEPSLESLQRMAPTVPPAAGPRRRMATQRVLAMGALLLVTLGVGWWLGKQSSVGQEPAHAEPVASASCVCASANTAFGVPVPLMPSPAVTTPANTPTSAVASLPSTTAAISETATPVPSAAVTPPATTAPPAVAAVTTPPVDARPKPKPQPKPTTASTFAAAPRPKPTATPPPRPPSTPTTRTGSKPAYHPDDL